MYLMLRCSCRFSPVQEFQALLLLFQGSSSRSTFRALISEADFERQPGDQY